MATIIKNYDRSRSNFRTRISGDWNDYLTWEIQNADGTWEVCPFYPQLGNPVELLHDVELTQNEQCKSIVYSGNEVTNNGWVLFVENDNPIEISGLQFYSDSQDASLFTDVGSGVISEVIDKSNPALICTQITSGSRAVRELCTVNNKYGIKFDGINDFYVGTTVMSPTFTKVITFLVQDLSATITYNLISSNSSAGSPHQLAVIKNSTNLRIRDSFSTMAKDYPVHNADGVITLIQTFTSGSQKTYFNGVLIDTKTTAYTVSDTNFNLGSYNNGQANTFFKGYMFDFAIYNRVLTAGEILEIDLSQRFKFRMMPSDALNIAGMGQSNEKGSTSVLSANNTIYLGFDYIDTLRHFRDLKDSTGDTGDTNATIGSYHPPLINRLNTLTGKKVVFIVNSKSASGIAEEEGGGDNTLHWGATGTLRPAAYARIDNALKQLPRNTLDWIIINQGERSVNWMAAYPTWTKADYKAAFIDLVNNNKTKYPGVKHLIIQTVQGRNTSGDTALHTTQWTWVTEAQQEIVAELSDMFLINNTIGATITNGKLQASDGIHYTQSFNSTIGIAAANKIYDNL